MEIALDVRRDREKKRDLLRKKSEARHRQTITVLRKKNAALLLRVHALESQLDPDVTRYVSPDGSVDIMQYRRAIPLSALERALKDKDCS